jgi:AcrR family transcriptional regulator
MKNKPYRAVASEGAARERILLAAHDLFYRDGIRATGVDRLFGEAKVAKVTFYRHFPSKDDLIGAFLAYRHNHWMEWFTQALERHRATQTPAERLRAPLEPLRLAMAEWLLEPTFRGCAFINTVAELGGAIPEVCEIAERHKQDMAAAIAGLLPPGPGASSIAQAAALPVDGAIVRAQSGVAHARQALEALGALLECLARASRETRG